MTTIKNQLLETRAKIIREMVGGPGIEFQVCFGKRTGDKELRVMRCEFREPEAPIKNNLMIVWDKEKKGLRSVPLDGLVTVTIHGNVYTIGKVE